MACLLFLSILSLFQLLSSIWHSNFFQNEEIISYDKDGNVISRAVKRFDAVYARKLAFQARLQLLAKWAPNKYGEKPVIDTNESRASKILEARRRIASASELTENRHDLTD